MQDEIVTIEEAANKLALRCARWSHSTIEDMVKSVLAGGPLGELGALYAAHSIVLTAAPDIADRLTVRLDLGQLKARNPMHGGHILLNGQPAHKGIFVSLAEAEQALREHDQIIFADPPIHDEEPVCAIDPAPEQVAAEREKIAPAKVIRGISKQAVMNAFEGIHFDRDHWSKNLASPPVWLKECRVCPGSKKASASWNPVLIAAALHDKHISMKVLDAVFVGLKDWLTEWREISDMFRD